MNWKAVLLLLSLICLASLGYGEEGTKTVTKMFSEENSMMLRGLGGIVVVKDGILVVDMVMPKEQRSEKYAEVDLEEGDRIMMVNGKRAKSIGDLRTVIDELKVGEMIKLGIRRDEQMMIVTFEKADPSDQSGNMMVMEGGGHSVKKVVKFGEGEPGKDGTVAVLDCGLILAPTSEGLKVMAVMPQASEKISGDIPEQGDLVLSINGKMDADVQAFQTLYDEFPDGEEMTILFKRDDKELKATYTKTTMTGQGQMIIKRKSE